MNFSDISTLVMKSAPVLGLALGGPVGAVVTEAANLIASAFGGDANNPQDLAKKINADANAQEKLSKLQNDHLDQIVQLTQMHYSDVSDARQREEKMAQLAIQAGEKIDNTPRILALTYNFGFLATIIGSVLAQAFFPQLNFMPAISIMGNGEMFLLGYYFGSSNKENKS